MEKSQISDEDWSEGEDDADADADASSGSSEYFDEEEDASHSDGTAIDSNYMAGISSLLEARSEVNCTNCLDLNKEMQRRLSEARDRLQALLTSVRERYKANEERLKRNMLRRRSGVGMKGAYLKGGTFYFKGNIFFRDANCRSCPNNADYVRRSNADGEMFPMDFELRARHVWSVVDKVGIVQAVKEQIIDHLRDQNALQRASARNSRSSRQQDVKRQISVHSETLVKLLEQVDDSFTVDWDQVSAHNLRYRHSPSSCKAMWNVYLQPALKRTPWTDDENLRLVQAAQMHNFQNWQAIAAVVGRRSDYQCFVQYETSACQMLPQRWVKWNPVHDQQLLKVIERNTVNGIIKWNMVLAHFPNKSKSAIQQRYFHTLNPRISHAQFTPEEDLILLAAVEEFGTKFSCFPRTLFPNRNIVQLRSRYRNTLQHRHKQTPWSVEDDKKLIDFVSEHGPSEWCQCAQALGNHSRISCRTRFLTIQKFFEQNPNATLADLPRKKACRMSSTISTENWTEKIQELRANPYADFTKRAVRQRREKPKKTKLEAELPVASEVIAEKPCEKENKSKQQSSESPISGQKGKRRKRKRAAEVGEPKATKLQVIKQELEDTKMLRPRPCPLYVDRLRTVGLLYYEYLKYSYNFKMGDDPVMKVPKNTRTVRLVANALGFKPPAPTEYVLDSSLPPLVRQNYKARLQNMGKDELVPYGHLLAPSWPSMMGLRALCIQHSEVQASLARHVREQLARDAAVQRFRQRLRSLFYTTILLSRLQVEEFSPAVLQCIPEVLRTGTSTANEASADEEVNSDRHLEESINTLTERVPSPKSPKAQQINPKRKAVKRQLASSPVLLNSCKKKKAALAEPDNVECDIPMQVIYLQEASENNEM